MGATNKPEAGQTDPGPEVTVNAAPDSLTPEATTSPSEPDTDSATIVVGLGASAGGLEALQAFFDHLPADTGAAYVVVQHLSPDFKSLMDEILRRNTGMPIEKVEDSTPLQADRVYLLPPRCNIVIDGARLRVESQTADHGLQRPIDVFFESMATSRGEASIAVVLSGTGSDGARGVQSVKEAGGIILVQDPASAAFDGMPVAAIGTDCADFVLPPNELARKVAALVAHPFLRSAARKATGAPTEITPYETILRLLKVSTGYDLTYYKPGTIIRRIERRMSLRHIRDAQEYVQVLERDPGEIQSLAHDCFINVTRFFRDLQAFWSLRQHLNAMIVQSLDRADPLRIWVAGCSTGEEAYSIASMVDRSLRELGARFEFKVFATDLDEVALRTASDGRYPRTVEADVPRTYFEHLLRRDDGDLRVLPGIRNRIVFARHDVLRDPPFPRADLVLCRNLLIYLQPEAQRTALERFHFALRRGGLLFLGLSETVEPLQTDFQVMDNRWKIYSKRGESRLPRLPVVPGMHRSVVGARPSATVKAQLIGHPVLRACERMVGLFAEAGVVVSESGEVIYTFGDVTRWLTLPRGAVTTQLRDLLPPDTATAVMLALRRAHSVDEAVHVAHVPSADGADSQSLDLVHVPHTENDPGFDVLLLGRKVGTERESVTPAQDIEPDPQVRRHVETLERELQTTRASLQTTIEELETTNEELQSVNEELLASNEELQSTNEELHSVNEELYTVNAEHQQKITELAQVTDDLENVLRATDIGTVFLDADLRLRRFTPSAEIALPLREPDVGRSVLDLVTHLQDLDLGELVLKVVRDRSVVETQARTKSGVPLLVRVHPFMAGHSHPGGAVITFVNMSRIEEAQRHAMEEAQVLRSIVLQGNDVLWAIEADTRRVRYLSPGFERVWNRRPAVFIGDPMAWTDAVHQDDRERVEKDFQARLRGGNVETEYRIALPDGGHRLVRDRTYGTVTGVDGKPLLVGILSDISADRELERQRWRLAEMHRLASDRSPIPMLILRDDGSIVWSNRMARRSLGLTNDALPRSMQDILATAEDQRAWREAAAQVLASSSDESATPVLNLRRCDGVSVQCEFEVVRTALGEREADGLVCQWFDVSDKLARERELNSQVETFQAEASNDPLTRLLNRRGLERQLERHKGMSRRRGEPMVVVLVDCDHFKFINDTHGHAAGDLVLREVARRMRSALRPADLLGRIGGDEFMAILPATRLAEGAHVGEKLRRAVSETKMTVAGAELPVTVSVGVAPVSIVTASIEALVALASPVLKICKQAGRDRVAFADGDNSAPTTIASVDAGLERLLAGEVRVVEQTVNDVQSGEVVGFELLCRGVEPLVSPTRFFEASRRAGCLERLDLVCFAKCVTRANEINGGHRFHVNLFPNTLVHGDLRQIEREAARINQRSKYCIEISEQQFVGEASALRDSIDHLRSLGFRIAIDDVGFGHSALETLLAVEPDVVKIDRSLVAEIDRDGGAQRVLSRLVNLFDRPGTEIIAEGVEREGQRKFLEKIGVTLAQGYLWSRPDGGFDTTEPS